MYQCKHFAIHELVPPEVYKSRGNKAWELLDERLLETIDKLRDWGGSITINNYNWGGKRKWSGLRTPESPYYSPTSQHSLGKAADLVFAEKTPEEVREHILSNRSLYPYITGLELGTPTWTHIDVRNYNGLKTFTA